MPVWRGHSCQKLSADDCTVEPVGAECGRMRCLVRSPMELPQSGSVFMAAHLAPGEDVRFLLYSLIVVIVGGMGSIPGAAIGAL